MALLYDILMINVGYMTVHVPPLQAFLSHRHPLVSCCPDKRGFTVLQVIERNS